VNTVLDKVHLMVVSEVMVELCPMTLPKKLSVLHNTHFHISLELKPDMKAVEVQVVLKMLITVAMEVVLFGLVQQILSHCMDQMLLLLVKMVFVHHLILLDLVVELVVLSN